MLTIISSRLVQAGGIHNHAYSPSKLSTTINSLNEGWAGLFQSSQDFTASEVGFQIASKVGNPGNLRISLQLPDATDNGEPSGVLGGGSPASVTVATSSLSAGWNRVVLDNPYSVSRGDWINIVAEAVSGTWDGSNYLTANYRVFNPLSSGLFGTSFINTGGGFSRQSYSCPLSAGDGTQDRIGWTAMSDITQSTYALDGNGSYHENALKFVVPDDGLTYSLLGIGMSQSISSTDDFSLHVYEGGGTDDTTSILDEAVIEQYTEYFPGALHQLFATPVALTSGQSYRVATRQSSTASQTWFFVSNIGDNDARLFESNGWDMSFSHRQTGNWTDVALVIPVSFLIVDVTAGSGSAPRPSLRGGFQN